MACEESASQLLLPVKGRSYSPYLVGFVGAGKMAQGIASGLLAEGILKPADMLASAPSTRNTQYFKDKLAIRVTHDNAEVFSQCCLIVIAVKPHLVQEALSQLKEELLPHQRIVSIAAGITVNWLEKHTPSATPIIRAMPTMSVQVRAGVTVYTYNRYVSEGSLWEFKTLFEKLGICEQVPESMIDAVTGMAGSGAAFVLVMMQALADGGVKMGIPRHLANHFAVHTFLGTAKLVEDSGKHPAILAEEIASPGGTTIHGLHQLEKGAVRAAIINAVEAATERANSLCQTKASSRDD